MQIKDFQHPMMVWSMYDGTPMEEISDNSTREEIVEAFDSQELELDAPVGLASGIYDFSFYRSSKKPYYGIVVMDGKFEPHATAHAIYLAQVDIYRSLLFDYVYIESLEWDGEKFVVSIGS